MSSRNGGGGRGYRGGRGGSANGRGNWGDRGKQQESGHPKGGPEYGGAQTDNKARVNPQIPLLYPPRSKSAATVKERLASQQWKEVVSDFLSQEYKGMGRLLETGEVPYLDEPDVPTMEDDSDPFNAENDPHHLARARYTKTLEGILSANGHITRDLPAVHAVLWDALSTASQL
jgi:hypothetical protein